MKLSEYMEELSKDLNNMPPFKLKSVIQQIKQHPDYDEHLFKPFMDELIIDTGWLFVGSDFSALEDRIVAILSDDPMKKKPFTEGVDGHCLNAYGYFKDQMQQIDESNLNDIKKLYPELRQDSKAPTFA